MDEQRIRQIIDESGFKNGNRWESPLQVREYFSVAEIQRMSGSCDWSEDELKEVVRYVYANEIHVAPRVTLYWDIQDVARAGWAYRERIGDSEESGSFGDGLSRAASTEDVMAAYLAERPGPVRDWVVEKRETSERWRRA